MGACSSTSKAASGAAVATAPSKTESSANNAGVPSALRTGGGEGGGRVSFTDEAAKVQAAKNEKEKAPTPGLPPIPKSPASDATSPTAPAWDESHPTTPRDDPERQRIDSQDASVGSNFSTNSDSSRSSQTPGSSDGNGNGNGNGSNRHPLTPNGDGGTPGNHSASGRSVDLSASHRRRRSRHLDHTDSKVGLHEIVCGDVKNPNFVRIEVPLGKPIEEVYEGVHDGPVLGSGISGIVRLVKHRATQVSYAVKCLDLALIDSEQGLRQLKEEIYIMCQLDHPNIVRLEEVYESHSEIYLVQEVCKGGELFDRLDEQPDYHYTEAQCARLVKQMLSSVRYIHNKGIIHRDLKLENFLFSEAEPESELKMIDFGLSKHFAFGEVHHEAVGTPYTVAPEVIRGSYDERCDVWAIGVITYLLLSGEPPFGGCGGPETLLQVRDNILRGAFRFEPADIWETVSPEAKDFIKSLLVIDPMDRPTARQAKDSKWLKMWSSRENGGKGVSTSINPNVVKALVGFKEYSDMRKLLCEVLSFTLLPEQIQGLRMEFEKYDRDGTGEITLSTLKKVLIGNAATGSLGGLTEGEVVDIFEAMRVRKGETSIHWHDFIAAGLSQCQVDDRNLRLAFERLDQEHKGYITFENVMDLMGDMGDDTFEKEDQMLQMWGESMKDVNCKTALINYEDFVLLMKGQKRDRELSHAFRRASIEGRPSMEGKDLRSSLQAVPEILSEEEDEHANDVAPTARTPPSSFNDNDFPEVAPSDAAAVRKPKLSPKEAASSPDSFAGSTSPSPGRFKNFVRMGSNSAPVTPIHHGKRLDDIDPESPLGGSAGRVTFNDQCAVKFAMPDLDLTPPQTPVRGPADYVTPNVARATMHPQLISNFSPPDLLLPDTLPGMGHPGGAGPPLTGSPGAGSVNATLTSSSLARARSVSLDATETRGRSVSLDEKDPFAPNEAEPSRPMLFKRDSRRAMAIPEHTHNLSDIEKVIEDKTKTPLVVNRKLYRAHREFRHAVTEACKRFEDEQMRRAKETLRAQEDAVIGGMHTAGLVMRHGQALSEQSIKNFLKKTLEEQQKQVDQANRRGGRGRRSRKKTISDMSGMLGGPALPEAHPVATRKTVAKGGTVPDRQEALAPVKENENLLRNPTKPGEFRKTNYDPFQRKQLNAIITNKPSPSLTSCASMGTSSSSTQVPLPPPMTL